MADGRERELLRRLDAANNKKFLRHHTAGLGDGKIHKGQHRGRGSGGVDRGPPPRLPPGHAGGGIVDNRAYYVRTRDGRSQSRPQQQEVVSPFDPPDVLDRAAVGAGAGRVVDEGVVPYVPQSERRPWDEGAAAAGAAAGVVPPIAERPHGAVVAEDGPWQISVLALLGIIAILVALFLHLIGGDPQASAKGNNRPHYHHHPRRPRRHQGRSISFQSKKKKTDELSEDDFMSDVDGSYQADSEARVGGVGSALPRAVSPAPLYYPMDYNPPQQQHRQRKQVVVAGSSGATRSPVPNHRTVIDSHPYYHRTTLSGGVAGAPRIFAEAHAQERSPGTLPKSPAVSKAQPHQINAAVASPTPRRVNEAVMAAEQSEFSGLGTGLEGFALPTERSPSKGEAALADEAAVLLSPLQPQQQQQQQGRNERGELVSPVKNVRKVNEGLAGEKGQTLALGTDGAVPRRIGTSSPFESFNSLPLEDETPKTSEQIDSLPYDDSATRAEFRSSPKGATPSMSAQDPFGLDQSPSGLRNRRVGEQERIRQSVAVMSGSCDHDFTPRVDNVKRIISFSNADGKMHDSDVESASGEALPPPPLYSSADEGEEVKGEPRHEMLGRPSSAQATEPPSLEGQRMHQQRKTSSKAESSRDTPDERDQPLMYQGVPLPLIPDLEYEKSGSTDVSTPAAPPRSLSVHELARPPRSVTLEELHLIKMESGDFEGSTASAKWTVACSPVQSIGQKAGALQVCSTNLPRPHEPEITTDDEEEPEKQKGQKEKAVRLDVSPSHESIRRRRQDSIQGFASPNRNESQRQLMIQIAQKSPTRSSAQAGAEPATPIDHKRPDVTEWSDSALSLTLPIDFSELNLMSVIGGGGFGQVWKAMWRGTPVAVKVLSSSAQTENVPRAVLEEFASEINMVSGMRHPNICLYMGACLDPPNRAIVTEFAAHGSLWDALRSPLDAPYSAADGTTRNAWPLSLFDSGLDKRSQGWYGEHSTTKPALAPAGAWPWVLVKRVASGACRGMTYLHSGKPPVLHRDLKSANLLLDDSYTTKVADFGLSRIKAQERSMTGNCGTVQWMAPEILANQSYAEPADVYSFGIILWELLSRECPFEGMSPIQCALGVLNENARPTIPVWCPPSFVALIKACVDRNPSSRPTFPQILSALDAMP